MPATLYTGSTNASRPGIEHSGRKPLVTRFGGIPSSGSAAVIADRVPIPGIIRHKELVTRLPAEIRCLGHYDTATHRCVPRPGMAAGAAVQPH